MLAVDNDLLAAPKVPATPPAQPRVLAADVRPTAVASVGGVLYFVGAAEGGTALYSLTGDGAPRALAPIPKGIFTKLQPSTAAGHVYWAASPSGARPTIGRLTIDGGAVTTVELPQPATDTVRAIAGRGDVAFVVDDELGFYRVNFADRSVTPFADQSAIDVVISGSRMYWVDARNEHKIRTLGFRD